MKTFINLTLATLTIALFSQLASANPCTEQKPTERLPKEDTLRATISTFFSGMLKADTALIKSVLLPGARLQTVINKDGKVSIQEGDFGKFLASVSKAKPGSLDERLGNYMVLMDGDLATAFTPYEFWYNGQQSHCGANAFTLVRVDGSWKVQAIIDTRRKCQ